MDVGVVEIERRRMRRRREGVIMCGWTFEVTGWGVIMDWNGLVVVMTGLKTMTA